MTVGERILSSDPALSALANTSARRCGGLPLALITVAGAMARRKTLCEWRYTDELLRTNPWEIDNMGGRVLPLLKFSYDSLNNDITKNCFLYCSIFPEGYNIRIDELIDLWIGEGLQDGLDPCDQGEFIVGTLKLASLLENDESKQCVRMHDILRHMALWLARDQGKNKNKVLVAKSGRITVQELTKWEEAKWISLFGSRVSIDHSPFSPYLSTLLLRDAQLESFPGGFFDSMPALKFLDLSGNQGLLELPSDIGNVKNLQYLNLSSTSIAELPNGLRNFRKLKCLLLDYNKNLNWIPKEVISDLSLLQVYSKIDGVMEFFGSVKVVPYDEVGFLEVLERLNHIKKIGVTIFSTPSLEKILESYILRSCIKKLTFMECTGLVSVYFSEDLSNLERLELFHCGLIKEFKVSERCKLGNLRKVYIADCPLLLNLNFLAYATNLEILTIVDCESLKDVTSKKMAFPGLKTLSLTRLQNLKSICQSPSSFPSPLEIEVSECPLLKQLPFELKSANSLLRLRGETEWWDGLIWDNKAIKDACRLKFISTPVNLLVPEDQHLTSRMSWLELDNCGIIDIAPQACIRLADRDNDSRESIIQMNIEESVLKHITKKLEITKFSECPYLVVCYKSFYENGAISMFLEYMDGGSLADFLKKVISIPEPYLAAICKQVLKGFMYLHLKEYIIHRDIKPSNLLINTRGEIKITDLGLSARLESTSGRANTFVGTYNYMSPERIMGGSYDITADIWSLGLVLLECATGKFPYSPPEQAEGRTNLYELMEEIVEQPPPCAPSDQFSPEFYSFISACLQKDPKQRKSSHELLALPFMNMYDDLDVDLSSYFTNARSLATF